MMSSLALVPAIAIGCDDDDDGGGTGGGSGGGAGGGSGGGAGGGSGGACEDSVDADPACEACICAECETQVANCDADPDCAGQVSCAQAAVAPGGDCSMVDPADLQACVISECAPDAPALAYLLCINGNCAAQCVGGGDAGM